MLCIKLPMCYVKLSIKFSFECQLIERRIIEVVSFNKHMFVESFDWTSKTEVLRSEKVHFVIVTLILTSS